MLVVYRITDIPSTNPSPIFQEDKKALNELCLKSFIEAFKDVQLSMIFLCDFCSYETVHMISKLVPNAEIISTNVGINETMLMSYQLASKQDDDILFQECDYYWLPDTGKLFVEAVDKLGLVSPYDNLNFYLDPSIHSEDVKLRLVDGHHFRSVERVTMTFGLKRKILVDNYEIFKKYGYLDNDVWHELRAKGHQMWTPVPALATHMVKDYLAPSIDWNKQWKN